MPIEHHQANSLEELVREVLLIAGSLPVENFLWYRGIRHGSHRLLPGIMRDSKSSGQVFDREGRLLTRFRQRSLPYWPAGYPQSPWEHMFAMQHFGIPTRLLDWSENLFVAAHFALLTPTDQAEAPVIWCVDPIGWNRSTPLLSEFGDSIQVLTTSDEELGAYEPLTNKKRNKSPVAIFGTHNSGRIVAQRGTFIVWGEDCRPLEDFADDLASAKLWRIELTGDKARMAFDLSRLGFSETMVIPELSALASELTRVEGWRTTK